MEKRGRQIFPKIVRASKLQYRPRALQHYTHVSCVEICHIARKFHEKKMGETLVWKSTRKNTLENTRKLGKFACKTLHTSCYNLRVFGLLEFLHRWLSECSCTCAGGFKLSRHVQMLAFNVIWAKSDPSFLTEWTLFLNIYKFFAWIFICRLQRDYKKVSTKISFSHQFTTILMDQLLCFGEGSLLHVFCLQHFMFYFYLARWFELFSQAAISFVLCPSCNIGPKQERLVTSILEIIFKVSFSSQHRHHSVASSVYV